MSYTLTFTGNESVLSASFNPPLYLDPSKEYVMGLTKFDTFNAIPNISKHNNALKFDNRLITLPEGSYEIMDIADFIQSKIGYAESVHIKANSNTLKTEIKSTREIDFDVDNSIGPLLGFDKKKLKANRTVESDHTAKITKVNSILVKCNVTTGNFKNGVSDHILYQFFPNAPPGYKIIESPINVIYLPILTNILTYVELQILDQDQELVSFRQESVTIELHLKEK